MGTDAEMWLCATLDSGDSGGDQYTIHRPVIAGRDNVLSWTWKSGRTSSAPRALAMQPWVCGTHMHLCAAARWSHQINMTLHATFCAC